jgi:hypothetical protein
LHSCVLFETLQQPTVNWKDLENVWEESDEHDKPVQMDLFYGGQSTTVEGMSADDGAEGNDPEGAM